MIDREWCQRKLGEAKRWNERAAVEARRARRGERLNASWAREAGRHLDVANAAASHKRARYAKARARTLALERSAVVATCGQRSIALRCACGPSTRAVGCGQVLLCDECRRPYYRRIRRRALGAVVARLADALTTWHRGGRQRGRRPQIVLVTLTIPRKLDGQPLSLADRRRRLVEGWRKFRQWLHKRIGAFPFVALPELTPGDDGTGHLHYHAICVWPWWNWRESQAEWRRATGLPDANPPDMRVVKDTRRAAHYVAKYATKGADCDDGRMSGELMADFVATFYGKRRITPSVGFWVPRDPPRCPCCHGALVVVERPQQVAHAAATWKARRLLAGVDAAAAPPDERPWLQVAPDW